MGQRWAVTLSGKNDRAIYDVLGRLRDGGFTLVESQQHRDSETGTVYLRAVVEPEGDEVLEVDRLHSELEQVTARLGAPSEADPGATSGADVRWQIFDLAMPLRVLILVSKEAHCLNEILFRNSIGDLRLEVVAVVSNHEVLNSVALQYHVPFRHIPVTPDGKQAAEAELLALVAREHVDLVVLARYMQILSEEFTTELENRIINIHHSMLPAFKGARPYHQAYARGVKVIGATAHYATADLDEGPIIEQQTVAVDRASSVEEFVTLGRALESRALGHAIRWHAEGRIVVDGIRTVVFR